jgi:farnesyl diphosphate synthase
VQNPSPHPHSPQTFAQALARSQGDVQDFLTDILTKQSDVPGDLLCAMEAGTLYGGKRLRPFFHLEAVRLLDGPQEGALYVAGALELVHCYSLVHDDLPSMDNAALRRGTPTVHCLYGAANALLAGNALLTLAFEVLEAAPLPAQIRLELIKCLARASGGQGMMAGQFYDLQKEAAQDPLMHAYKTQRLKTGALFEACFESALILTHTPTDHPLRVYAQNLGLAFQILDDLQDQFSNEEETGKTTGLDEGKVTFVSLLGPVQARDKGILLLEEAVVCLGGFGQKANILQEGAKVLIKSFSKIGI